MSDPTTPGTMSWPPRDAGSDRERAARPAPFPHEVATVQEGLEKLSQSEYLVALDEVMSRRPHNKTLLPYQVHLWRQDRTSWGNARDRRADAKEAADE